MTPARLTPPALAMIATVACTEATPPQRAPTYDFTINCAIPDLCSSEADTSLRLTFRWSTATLPVRIWVEPTGDLSTIVRRGVAEWERAVLYGEFRAVLVADSTTADVIVRLGDPGTAGGSNDLPPLDCRGQTEFEVGLDTAIVLPFHISIAPRLGASGGEVNECYHTVTTHELGHAFGLLLHSTEPSDLMHVRPTVPLLSRRDVATFTTLYHTRPTVRLPATR